MDFVELSRCMIHPRVMFEKGWEEMEAEGMDGLP
jgi:hypothetical protein